MMYCGIVSMIRSERDRHLDEVSVIFSRNSTHFSKPSRAGQRACPHFVKRCESPKTNAVIPVRGVPFTNGVHQLGHSLRTAVAIRSRSFRVAPVEA